MCSPICHVVSEYTEEVSLSLIIGFLKVNAVPEKHIQVILLKTILYKVFHTYQVK